MTTEPAPVRLTTPRAGGRIRLTPTADGGHTTRRLPLEDPLQGATDEERAFYLANYSGIPLAELLRRLRLAERNADHYQREHEAAREREATQPPAWLVHQVDARHKRIKALLDGGGRISRALLTAALAENDDTWNARHAQAADRESAK